MKQNVPISGIVAAACLAGLTAVAAQAQDARVTMAPGVSGNWSGSYAGVNVGGIEFDGDGIPSGDSSVYGVHIGTMTDMGDAVFGAELEIDRADMDLGAAGTADATARIKLRAGRDLGNTLVYATGGVAVIDTDGGNEVGVVAGFGVTQNLRNNYYYGAEILGHRFNSVGPASSDVTAYSFSFRGGIRF